MGTRYIKVYQLACDDINNTEAFLNLAGEAFKLLKRLCWTSQYSLDIFHRDQRAESWVLRRPEFVTRLANSSLRFSRIHQHRSSSTFFQMHVFMGRRHQLLRWGACNRDESKGNPTFNNSSGQFGLRWWDISGFIVKHGRLTWFDQQRDVISSETVAMSYMTYPRCPAHVCCPTCSFVEKNTHWLNNKRMDDG